VTNALDERARHASNALRDAAAQRIAQTAPAAVVSMETRRHRTPLLLMAAAIVAVVALVAGVVATNDSEDAAPDIATTTPDRFEVAGRWSVAKHHGTLTSNGDIVWVGGAAIPACPPGAIECSRSSAQRVDTKTGTVTNLEPVPGAIQDLAYGFGSLWVAHASEAAGFGISRINPDTGKLMETWTDYNVNDLAVTADAVWAIGEKLVHINPADNQVAEFNILPGTNSTYSGYDIVPAGDGVVFVATDFTSSNSENSEVVIRADREGAQRTITTARMPSIAVDGDDLWVADEPGTIDHYDLRADQPVATRYDTGEDTRPPMIADRSGLWFPRLDAIAHFDPKAGANAPFDVFPIEGGPVPTAETRPVNPEWIVRSGGGFWALGADALIEVGTPTN
jgi:hypothetical protein